MTSLDLDTHEHQSVILHRLEFQKARAEDKRIYGGHPGLYVGSGNGVFWFGVGGDEVVSELNFAIDQYLATAASPNQGSTAPLQIVFRMLPWLELPERENNPDQIGRMLANDAMSDGGDAVRIEIRPSEAGARVRMQFEEGFVKLLGSILATQYDQSQL